MGRQALGVAVFIGGIRDKGIMKACTGDLAFAPEGDVRITESGPSTSRRAKVFDRASDGTLKLKRALESESAGGTIVLSEVAKGYHSYQATKSGAMRCTEYQLHEAKLHAKERYPGAKSSSMINGHVGISPKRAEFVARCLRDEANAERVEST